MSEVVRTIVTAAGYEPQHFDPAHGGRKDIVGWVSVLVREGSQRNRYFATSWDGLNSANVCEKLGRARTLKDLVGREWTWIIEDNGSPEYPFITAYPIYPEEP